MSLYMFICQDFLSKDVGGIREGGHLRGTSSQVEKAGHKGAPEFVELYSSHLPGSYTYNCCSRLYCMLTEAGL